MCVHGILPFLTARTVASLKCNSNSYHQEEAEITKLMSSRPRQQRRWLDGITNSMEFEPTPGDSEGQEGSLVRCHAHDRDESDTRERLNSNNKQAQELYSAGFGATRAGGEGS